MPSTPPSRSLSNITMIWGVTGSATTVCVCMVKIFLDSKTMNFIVPMLVPPAAVGGAWPWSDDSVGHPCYAISAGPVTTDIVCDMFYDLPMVIVINKHCQRLNEKNNKNVIQGRSASRPGRILKVLPHSLLSLQPFSCSMCVYIYMPVMRVNRVC